jgi:hypothetical protein
MKIKEIGSEIKKELKDGWFWFYIIAMLVLGGIIWGNSKTNFLPKTLIIIIFFLFPIIQFVYNIKIKMENKFQDFLRWFYFLVLTILPIIYLSVMVGEIQIGAILLVILAGLGLISMVGVQLRTLIKSKGRIPLIIINYLIFVFLLIILFGFIYSFSNAFEQSKIINQENIKIQGTEELIYFSTSVFYSNIIGYYPLGVSKWIVQIEVVISYLVHIIVLSYLLSEIKKKIPLTS